MDSHSALDQMVNRCGELYTLPAVAVRVLQLTESPSVDLRALKDCIENDPALTTKILRVVNSSLFGMSREVTDLNQALALLGTNPLKLLVLGFSLPESLFLNVNGDILRRYWHRALIKAVAARELSRGVWNLPGDEAFIAGLLQDLGMLALLQQLRDSYADFIDCALAKSHSLALAEIEALGFDHYQLGARLLERWSLPKELVSITATGNDRGRIALLPPQDLGIAQIVHLADLLASVLAENRVDLLPELLELGHQYRQLNDMQVKLLVATLQEKVDQLADVLSLELSEQQQYEAVLADAYQRLTTVAEEVAGELIRPRIDGREIELLAEIERLSTALKKVTRTHSTQRTTEPWLPIGSKTVSAGAAKSPAEIPSAKSAQALADALFASEHPQPALQRRPAPTEMGYDPGLLGRLTAAVSTCRNYRAPLSLLLVEIDHYETILVSHGALGAERIVQEVGNVCRSIDHPHAACVQTREVQFAVVLPNCDRRQAVHLANELLNRGRDISAGSTSDSSANITFSVGVSSVATPPKNFPAIDLARSAERCLTGARLSGGNTVKSIEIY
jgi:HD-like signal output (HDOD) protein/GGDEF domain-containing protein